MRRVRRGVKYAVILLTGLLVLVTWKGYHLTNKHARRGYIHYRKLIYPPYNMTDDRKHDVILSAYMNSGSRFTGRLLGFNQQAFYFYEPLWKFSTWDYFQSPDIRCSATDGGCRQLTVQDVNVYRPDRFSNITEPIIEKIPHQLVPTDLFLHVISRAYTCSLLPLRHVIQDRVHDLPQYSGPSWEPYRRCIASFRARSECIRELEALCRNKTHRTFKVLRLTLGSFRPLLETNPRLKVIHLVRDPRAIINSRYFSRNYPVYGFQETTAMETNLCKKMSVDFSEGVSLMKDFPGRVKFLYYEDLLTHFNTRVQQVLQFLNIRYNRTEVANLAEIEVNLSPPEKGNEFMIDRKNNNANWWRRHMQLFEIRRVDSACAEVYERYGYKYIRDEFLIRNLSFPVLSIPEHLKF